MFLHIFLTIYKFTTCQLKTKLTVAELCQLNAELNSERVYCPKYYLYLNITYLK
jgi:hypothetical protein